MSAEPTSRDYTAIDEPSLLTALSDDAMAWAVARFKERTADRSPSPAEVQDAG